MPQSVVPLPGLAKGDAAVLPAPQQTIRAVLASAGRTPAWLAGRMGISAQEFARQLEGLRKLDLARIETGAPSIAIAYYSARQAQLEARYTQTLAVEREHRRLVAAVGKLSASLDDALADEHINPEEARELAANVAAVVNSATLTGRAVGR